jgi:hypothetical protein
MNKNKILTVAVITIFLIISLFSISFVYAQQNSKCDTLFCVVVNFLTGKAIYEEPTVLFPEQPGMHVAEEPQLSIQSITNTNLMANRSACTSATSNDSGCMPGGKSANTEWYVSWGPFNFSDASNRTVKIYHNPWFGDRNLTVYIGTSCGAQTTQIFKKQYAGNMGASCNNTGDINITNQSAGSYYITAAWDASASLSSYVYNLSFYENSYCGQAITSNLNLTGNLSCSGTGIVIGANNIVLDCAGYTIMYGTSSSGENYGIQNPGFSNVTIKNCNIGSTNDYSNNYAIAFYPGNSNGCLIYNNTLSGSQRGIIFQTASNTAILNNKIAISLSSPTMGVWINKDSKWINVTNNTISTNYWGIMTSGGNTSNVIISNNSITTTDVKIYLIVSLNFTLINNTLSGSGTHLYTAGVSGFLKLTDQPLGDYFFDVNIDRLIVEDTGEGKVEYLVPISASGSNFSYDMQISNNLISVNSSSGLNKPANLTLYSIPVFNKPLILRNGVKCNSTTSPSCYNFTALSGTAVFNVSGFTNYSIGEGPIACGDNITSNLNLADNLLNCPANGLNIGADNLIIDCKGYKINGTGTGINAVSATTTGHNVTVRNCTIEGFATSIDAKGANNAAANGSNGGNVNVENSKVISISSNGGDGKSSPPPVGYGGTGGTITLINSNSTNISSSGGNAFIGGGGGKVNLTSSNTSLIIAVGRSGGGDYGPGGIVQVSSSAVNEINVLTAGSGVPGIVIVINSSNVTHIKTYSSVSQAKAGNVTIAGSFVDQISAFTGTGNSPNTKGGFVNITNSVVNIINNYGGNTTGCGGLCYAAYGGDAYIWNSVVNYIDSKGGAALDGRIGGNGGNIVAFNSNMTFINVSGGFGNFESNGNGTGGAGGNITIINSKLNLTNITINLAGGFGAGGAGSSNGTAGTLKLNQTSFSTGFGAIKFSYVQTNKTNFNSIMNISNNSITLNSSGYSDYNQSANLTIYNAPVFTDRYPYRDGVKCPVSICTELQDSGTYVFSITGFTNYSVGEGALQCGDTITNDTNLTSNLLNCPADGLNIGADNLMIDCKGFKINGTGANGINATTGTNGYNVTVKNCKIEGFAASINASGADNNTGIAFYAGSVTVENSNITTIETNGGNARPTMGTHARNGGTVVITNTYINRINAKGGDAVSRGGQGGNITIINSTVSGNINISGGFSGAGSGASTNNGGTIIVINSSIQGNISAYGGGTAGAADYGASGGNITIFGSNVTNIFAHGGINGGTQFGGGTGGTVNITNAVIIGIYAYGSNCSSGAGDGGKVTIVNSSAAVINTYGGYSSGGGASKGNGGNVLIYNSNITTINNYGGGRTASAPAGNGGNISLINCAINLENISINISRGLNVAGGANGTSGTLKLNNSEFYSTNGKIKYFYTETQNTTFNSILNISNNSITVNSDTYPTWNVSANLTLNGISGFTKPAILRNGVKCDLTTNPSCYNFTALNGTVVLNVSSFTNYSIGEEGLVCGSTITNDTNLTGDLLDCAGNGLNIGADNITVDCQGHKIDYCSSVFGYGINNTGFNNVTIKNCVIKQTNISIDSAYGIYLNSANSSKITNNSINTTSTSIYVISAVGNKGCGNIVNNGISQPDGNYIGSTTSSCAIFECTSIEWPSNGSYYLMSNLTSSGTCIGINSNMVDLDCKGNTITYALGGEGNFSGGGQGVSVGGFSNISIKNCSLINTGSDLWYTYGVLVSGATNVTISDNYISPIGVDSDCIRITGSQNINIFNNKIWQQPSTNHESNGIRITGSSKLNITNNNITIDCRDAHAISCYSSTKATISSNDVKTIWTGPGWGHAEESLYLDDCSSNVMTNNKFISNGPHGAIHLRLRSNNNSFTNDLVKSSGIDFSDNSEGYGLTYNNTIINMTFNSSNYPTKASFTYSGDTSVDSAEAIADPVGMTNLSRYLSIASNGNVQLNLSYSAPDIPSWMNESSLKIYEYNGTNWIAVPGSGVDTLNKVIYSNLSNFSVFAPMGEPTPLACGDTITTNKDLTNNLLNCPANGLNIGTNNLVIDCNGFKINGTGAMGINATSATAGRNVTIKNCTIQGFAVSVNATGADNLDGNAYNGGNVRVENSNTANIETYGGFGNAGGPPGNSGNGGTINLINSNSYNLNAYGRDSDGNPGNGGKVMINNSHVNQINNYGGYSSSYEGGNGGNTEVFNSTVSQNINSYGQRADEGCKGGNVTIIDSDIKGNISSYSGRSKAMKGPPGGNVTLINSNTSNIFAYGGYAFGPGGSGSGGNIVITNSIVKGIYAYGNGEAGVTIGGNGGNVDIINSNLNLTRIVIDISGGIGPTNGTAGTLKLNNTVFYTTNGKLKYSYMQTSNTTFNSILNISNNSITVNSDNYPSWNVSANLTLYGIGAYINPAILRNGVKCDLTTNPSCYNFTALNGTVVLNVSSFTNYSIGEEPVFGVNAPENFTAALAANKQDIILNWSAVSGADGYKIWYDENVTKMLQMNESATDANITLVGESNNSWIDVNANLTQKRFYALASYKSSIINFTGNRTGKFDVEVLAGESMISMPISSNPLNFSAIMPSANNGAKVYTYNGTKWIYNYFDSFLGQWSLEFGFENFEPGNGYWTVPFADSKNITFAGDIATGNITRTIFSGEGTLGWESLSEGNFSSIMPSANNGAKVYTYNGTKWIYNYFDSFLGQWSLEFGFENFEPGNGYWTVPFASPTNITYKRNPIPTGGPPL